MKILTITCHNVYNYGASLQAYALQHFLVGQGYCCKIIDYRPPYLADLDRLYTLRPGSRHYWLYRLLGPFKILLALLLHRSRIKFWKRIRSFDHFTSKYLDLTDRYNSEQELRSNPPLADIYITGSDQVWNTDMNNGKDDSFYLGFAPSDKIRISYAASFGIPDINDDSLKHQVTERIKVLDWVSIREMTGVRLARSMGVPAVQVLDPVFLLKKEEWFDLCRGVEVLKCKYLLLYHLGKNDSYTERIVKHYSKIKGLKIVSINCGREVPYADVNINYAGPIEFLSLISNAEFVVSNSFHAAAFSLIFERQFVLFPLSGQNTQSRMKDLLDLFHLSSHFIDNGSWNLFPSDEIDYSYLTPSVEQRRNDSRQLLLRSIQQ